jgi:hypothetical protein
MTPRFARLLFLLLLLLVVGSDEAIKVDFGPGCSADPLEALHDAVAKAARRGLKRLPVELVPFLKPRSRDLDPLPALLEPPVNPVLAARIGNESEMSGNGGGSAEDGFGTIGESTRAAIGIERGG